MIVAALNWIEEKAKAATERIVQTIGGQAYHVTAESVDPLVREMANTVQVSTIGALILYLKWRKSAAKTEGSPDSEFAIKIDSIHKVSVVGWPDSTNHNKDNIPAISTHTPVHLIVSPPGPSVQWVAMEAFRIGLITQFVRSEARDALIAQIGKIEKVNEEKFEDNGYSLEVVTKKGVSIVGNQNLPGTIPLIPIRTFFEVQQAESPFMLRVKNGADGQPPSFALVEADGGAYRDALLQNIASYIEKQIKAHDLPKYTILY